ncbi:hypothetical protein GQ44DRAFT_772927 [Phaeosphaeriaceae sp. PMI808]|nr:hypothetical protein GQ44DRAFT_772927 [Phaeosphaeriaceae sp. PMI808]
MELRLLHILLATTIVAQPSIVSNTTLSLAAFKDSLITAMREELWAVNQQQLAAFYENHVASAAASPKTVTVRDVSARATCPPITAIEATTFPRKKILFSVIGVMSVLVGSIAFIVVWKMVDVIRGRQKHVEEKVMKGYFTRNMKEIWRENMEKRAGRG